MLPVFAEVLTRGRNQGTRVRGEALDTPCHRSSMSDWQMKDALRSRAAEFRPSPEIQPYIDEGVKRSSALGHSMAPVITRIHGGEEVASLKCRDCARNLMIRLRVGGSRDPGHVIRGTAIGHQCSSEHFVKETYRKKKQLDRLAAERAGKDLPIPDLPPPRIGMVECPDCHAKYSAALTHHCPIVTCEKCGAKYMFGRPHSDPRSSTL